MFHFLLIGFMMLVFLLIRRQWRPALVKSEEVIRLIALATKESYVAAQEEVQATVDYGSPDAYRCAVCLYPKSVRYCSSMCQILHWRRGHNDECRSPSLPDYDGEEGNDAEGSSNIELPSRGTEFGSSSLNGTNDGVDNDGFVD